MNPGRRGPGVFGVGRPFRAGETNGLKKGLGYVEFESVKPLLGSWATWLLGIADRPSKDAACM